MKIRRYLGKDTQEALLKVKMDLGNDAVILNTRKVRQKGVLRMFSKPMTEVLAAIDDSYGSVKIRDTMNQQRAAERAAFAEVRQTAPVQQAVTQQPMQQSMQQPIQQQAQQIQQQAQQMEEIQQIQPIQPSQAAQAYQAGNQTKPVVRITGGQSEQSDEKITALETKMSSMESMLGEIWKQLQSIVPRQHGGAVQTEKLQGVPKALQIFYNNLLKNEVEAEIAAKIVEKAGEKVSDGSNINESASMMYNIIAGMLGKPECIKLRDDGKPSVVIFIGPTGVGKTTTIAKIAANITLNHKKSVGFITADTYRIAAVEQLKTYAEILGIPVSVIYSPAEMKDAITGYSGRDVILIDTAGRSHKNKAQFEELKSLLQASEADEVYLVLSMTTSVKSCREILQNYNFLEEYKLIFTKLDEAPISGIILNTKYLTKKSLSYVTTGQSVPDDIEVANIDRITKNLLGSITG